MLQSNQNKSWKNQQKTFKGLIAVLSLALALSATTNFVQSSKLNNQRKENEALKQNNARTEQMAQAASETIQHLQAENGSLRKYVNTAHQFVLGIEPSLSENDSSCEKPNCPQCKAIKDANQAELKKYNDAIDNLRINPKTLAVLRQGPRTAE